MERYICPECGTDMKRSTVESSLCEAFPEIHKQPNLICPKCNFMILKRHYDFIYVLGKYGVAKLPPKEKDKGKREMSVPEMIFHAKNGDEMPEDASMPEYAAEKPPLGCKPYYIHIAARIQELCEAIERNTVEKDRHNRIQLWLKEIWLLNEMDRNLRYEEKRKVWKEDKHGKLQEMP